MTTPTTVVQTSEIGLLLLGAALTIPGYDKRRAVLRKLAGKKMAADGRSNRLIADINSFVAGGGKTYLPSSTKLTIAGIRDALSEPVLIALAATDSGGTVGSARAAIIDTLDTRHDADAATAAAIVTADMVRSVLQVLHGSSSMFEDAKGNPVAGRPYYLTPIVVDHIKTIALAVLKTWGTQTAPSSAGFPATNLHSMASGAGVEGDLQDELVNHALRYLTTPSTPVDDADAPFSSAPLPSSPAAAPVIAATSTTTTATVPTTETTTMTTTTEAAVEAAVATVAAAAAPAVTEAPAAAISIPTVNIPTPKPGTEVGIDTMLQAGGLPTLAAIREQVKALQDAASTATGGLAGAIAAAVARAKAEAVTAAPIVASGDLPNGKVVLRKAADVFAVKGAAAASFQFDVPTFEWDGPHPNVPSIDADYVFRPAALISLLLAFAAGDQRPWVYGHTGSGKSTLVEQIAARLNWPVMRVNFDSEITRMDLMGRETIMSDPATGKTITKFVDGILAQAVAGPNILLLDELDFVRPDISYVLQRALEGRGLLVTEDGGRYIPAHPMSRIVATANTAGQGDEHGMYQGARPQSLAFLDRFAPFIPVPYLDTRSERDLIMKRVPAIDPKVADMIAKYVTEHRQAFTNGEIMQPISPRGIGGLAKQYVSFLSIYPDPKKALARAFEDMVLNKANAVDQAIIKGLMDRVLAV
jgi:cobaltochelatase CobS subunit